MLNHGILAQDQNPLNIRQGANVEPWDLRELALLSIFLGHGMFMFYSLMFYSPTFISTFISGFQILLAALLAQAYDIRWWRPIFINEDVVTISELIRAICMMFILIVSIYFLSSGAPSFIFPSLGRLPWIVVGVFAFYRLIDFRQEWQQRHQEMFNRAIAELQPAISNNANLLQQWNVPEKWIPKEFLCAISRCFMDKSIRVGGTPEHYDENYLLPWVKKQGTHPITRKKLRPEDFQYDYNLGAKIKDYMYFMESNIKALLNLPDEQADKIVAEFLENLKTKYQTNLDKALTLNYAENLNQGFFCTKEIKKSNFVFNFMTDFANPYQILEIDQTYTRNEIAKAYRQLALRCHPDKNSDPNAQQRYILIQQAKDILVNEEKREIVDKIIAGEFDNLDCADEQNAIEYRL